MAILDVQFRRGDVSYGRSTSFDGDEEFVLGLLHSFAKSLHAEAGEPIAPLIGAVRRPSRSSYLQRLERELDAGGFGAVVQMSEGWSIGGGATTTLLVVIGGRGELSGEEMPVGSFALLPARHEVCLRAIGGDIRLLSMEIN